jgi:hypothetical protein
MSETRKTIRDRAARYVGSAINQTLNEAIKDGHKHLQRKYNYSHMETTTTIAVTSGDSTFTLPSDFKAIVNPEMSDEDGAGYQRMSGIIKQGIESRSTTDTGRPLHFRIWAGQGYLYDTADQDFTFRLEYIRWLPEPPTDDEAYGSDTQAQAFLDMVYEFLYFTAIARGYDRFKKYDLAEKWDSRAKSVRMELEHDDLENALSGIDLKMEMPG